MNNIKRVSLSYVRLTTKKGQKIIVRSHFSYDFWKT